MSLPVGFNSPQEMARVLVTYIPCDRRIRNELLVHFERVPEVSAIQAIRAERLAPRRDNNPAKPYDGYWPDEVARQAEQTTRDFLARLSAERRSA